MEGVIDILSIFRTIVSRVDKQLKKPVAEGGLDMPVFFDFGRYIEITRNLSRKDDGITTHTKKYPLVWVVVPHTVSEAIAGIGAVITDLQIVIATQTIPDSDTPARYEKNFYPVLFPIFSELKRQIIRSTFFSDLDFDNVFKWVAQPYWDGKDGSSTANMFNDYIDAIQLKNIQLIVNEETCDRFQLITGVAAH